VAVVITSLGVAVALDEEDEGHEADAVDGEHSDEETHSEADGGHSDDAEVINPILPVVPELIWGAICFALTFAVVRAFHPKIAAGMQAREARINEAQAEAEKATAEASAAMGDYEGQLSGARAEASKIIEGARGRGEEYRAEVMAGAQADVDGLKAEALTEITASKATALGTLRSDVDRLATGAASSVIGKPLAVADQTQAIEDYVNRNSPSS